MGAKKKGSGERQTKGGMLGKDYDSEARVEREKKETSNDESTPKISKNSAAEKQKDKPIH